MVKFTQSDEKKARDKLKEAERLMEEAEAEHLKNPTEQSFAKYNDAVWAAQLENCIHDHIFETRMINDMTASKKQNT